MPAFLLPSADGALVACSDFLAVGPLVISLVADLWLDKAMLKDMLLKT